MPFRAPIRLAVLMLSAVLGSRMDTATGCGMAFRWGQYGAIADESAIIIWDSAHKTQHFIRSAAFETDAKDLGFLVPTPTQPTLYESDNKAFDELARITAPRTIEKPRPSKGMSCGYGEEQQVFMPVGSGEIAPVRVLEEKRVAGYDAVVLEADAPDALSQWLKEHDYEFTPALTDWAAPYIKAGWKITAFKVAKKRADESVVTTSAVRMSFQTEQPFFPYRELDRKATAGKSINKSRRMLRVYFLSDCRVKGVLPEAGHDWPVRVAWSNKVSDDDREKVLEHLKLPGETASSAGWLTEFEDFASTRAGMGDVYFSKGLDQSPVEREPYIRYVSSAVPDEAMFYVLAMCVLAMIAVCLWRKFRGVAK